MKKILSGLLAACLLLSSITGCNKDLNVKPIDSVDAATALKTPGDVLAALVGCYTGLQNNNSYGGYIQFFSDLLADNGDITFVGTYSQPAEIQRKTILKDNGEVANMWLSAYITINRTNNVLTILFWMNVMQLPMNYAAHTAIDGQAAIWAGLGWSLAPAAAVLLIAGLAAHVCLTNAFRFGDATLVVPLDFLRVPLIALVGAAIYGEPIDVVVLVGAAVTAAGILWSLREQRAIAR